MTHVPEADPADVQEQAQSTDPEDAGDADPGAGSRGADHSRVDAAEGDLLDQELTVPVDDEY